MHRPLLFLFSLFLAVATSFPTSSLRAEVRLPPVEIVGLRIPFDQTPEYFQMMMAEAQFFMDVRQAASLSMLMEMAKDLLIETFMEQKVPLDPRCNKSVSNATSTTTSRSDSLAREAAARELLSLAFPTIGVSPANLAVMQSLAASVGATVTFADGGSERYTWTPVYGGSTLNVRAVSGTLVYGSSNPPPPDCSVY